MDSIMPPPPFFQKVNRHAYILYCTNAFFYLFWLMAKRSHNIHDTFVRESFSDPGRAVAFFERFLPENLVQHFDFKTLTVLNESYINETLKEHFSDLVFEISLKDETSVKTDVVLLFEHKSSPDRNVLFQVGHYMFAHWTKCLAEKGEPKPILPLIYYQGKKNWKVGHLPDLFKNYPKEIKNYCQYSTTSL